MSHARSLKTESWERNDDATQLRLAREIKISYAGPLAVKRAFPKSKWRVGGSHDFANIAGNVMHVYFDERMQYHWSMLLMLETEALLASNWFRR